MAEQFGVRRLDGAFDSQPVNSAQLNSHGYVGRTIPGARRKSKRRQAAALQEWREYTRKIRVHN